MSTRAVISIVDEFGTEVRFYRHSDGYPDWTLPRLEEFLLRVKSGELRDNASQSAGWLVLQGHVERYDSFKKFNESVPKYMQWKVGSFEPCGDRHADDAEYQYVIDLKTKTIKFSKVNGSSDRVLKNLIKKCRNELKNEL